DRGSFRSSGKLPEQGNRPGWPTPPRGGIEQLHGEVRARGLRTKGNRQERKAARRRRKDLLHEEVLSPGVSRAGAAAALPGSADPAYGRAVCPAPLGKIVPGECSVSRQRQVSPSAFNV